MIKVFQINECDWYAGDCTKGEILAAYMEDTGCSLDEATGMDDDYPIELTEEQLVNMLFRDEISNGVFEVSTFKEHLTSLIEKGTEFPCFFASTEY
jgi:hypothetical protein